MQVLCVIAVLHWSENDNNKDGQVLKTLWSMSDGFQGKGIGAMPNDWSGLVFILIVHHAREQENSLSSVSYSHTMVSALKYFWV